MASTRFADHGIISIQSTGQRAKSRQYQLAGCADKAPSRNQPPPYFLTEFGMEMPRKFRVPLFGLGLVPKRNAVDEKFIMHHAAPIGPDARIVVADDPAPIINTSHLPKQACGLILQPCLTAVIMEVVA